MQADFSVKNTLAKLVAGHLWVELKCVGATGFEKSLEKHMDTMKRTFPYVQEEIASINGAILLACKIQKFAGGAWDRPALVCKLLTGSGEELNISPGGVVTNRGRCKAQAKPSLGQVWAAMKWAPLQEDPEGPQYSKVANLLKQLGLKTGNAPKRSKIFNKSLARIQGFTGRILHKKLSGVPGKKPWVADKDTLREVYKLL